MKDFIMIMITTPSMMKRILESTEEQDEDDGRLVIVGFGLLFLSLMCLGSWPALLRLASTDPRSLPSSSCLEHRRRRLQRNQRQHPHQHQELSHDLHPYEEGGSGGAAAAGGERTDNNDNNDVEILDPLTRQENDGVMTLRHHHHQNHRHGRDQYQDLITSSTDTDNGFDSDEYSRRRHEHHHNRRRVPRDARLAYLDYAIAYTISSLIPLLLMMFFSGRDTEDDHGTSSSTPISSSSLSLLLPISAMVGGILLSLGNMSLQWSTTVYGAPLTTVVAIQASLTVTIGTTINYVLQPQLTHRPKLLLVGVLLFVTAIVIATKAHNLYGEKCQHLEQHPPKFQRQHRQQEEDDAQRRVSSPSPSKASPDIEMMSFSSDNTNGNKSEEEKIATATTILSQNQVPDLHPCSYHERQQHLHQQQRYHHHNHQRALWVAICGGSCFGFFSPAFNIAVNDPFGLSSADGSGGLSVPVANLWFSLAFTISSVATNFWLMISPPISSDLKPIRNIYNAFFTTNHSSNYSVSDKNDDRDQRDDTTGMSDRCCAKCSSSQAMGMWAGFVCGMANLLQFQGGRLVGFATADLVQAYPIVSTLWDILLFGEFRSTSFHGDDDDDVDEDDDDDQSKSFPPLKRSSLTPTNVANSIIMNSNDSSSSSSGRKKARQVLSYLVVMYVLYFGGITSIIMSFAKY
mmetsp:Transcript_38275/g.93048  ORF Transcript_38275/g.93048 Transcript_38275/m.93048 type:complete len:686 (+) Transcript_38275:90-2147(+)